MSKYCRFLSTATNTKFNLSSFCCSSIEIKNNVNSLELILKDNANVQRSLSYNPFWLRMNCHSDESKQPSSGQRTIDLNAIQDVLTIDRVQTDRNNVCIKWNKESKQPESMIPLDFLIENYPSNVGNVCEKYKLCQQLEFFDYEKMADKQQNGQLNNSIIFQWLKTIAEYGVCIVKNVPKTDGMVKNLAQLIAPVQNTIYGEVFDVRAELNPINIAYSNVKLDFHMDLVYYESPPGLQFLHCLEFDPSIDGGESIFLDSFYAAEQFRNEHGRLFETLTKIPATFQKLHLDRQRPVLMTYQRPHITLNHRNEITGVNWAPAFEGPLKSLTTKEIGDYYEAYFTFAKFLNNHPKKIEYKLKPGEAVVFNNRRILHGRNSFKYNGKGKRHFQGCYVNIDEFKSEVLVRELNELKRQFNNSNKNDLLIYVNNMRTNKISYGNQDYS